MPRAYGVGVTITIFLRASTAAGGTDTEADADLEESQQLADSWVTIVWNDPVNLMTYVSYVFEAYFGYSTDEAHRLMMQVHEDGRAVVSSGGRERVERDVQAMHGYGLWATMQRPSA